MTIVFMISSAEKATPLKKAVRHFKEGEIDYERQ